MRNSISRILLGTPWMIALAAASLLLATVSAQPPGHESEVGVDPTDTTRLGGEFAKASPLRVFSAASVVAGASSSQLSVAVESGGSDVVAATPGETIRYEIVGLLSDDHNEGLALVGFDLHFTGGELQQADEPSGDPDSGCENPMIHFTKPWGITNPAGFGGTIINGDLIQVGGAQNTVNNTPDNAEFPIGTVLTGVAQPSGCGLAVLVTGSLAAPTTPGVYTLILENLFANVIREGETGFPFWTTQTARADTVTNLTVYVDAVPPVIGACCILGRCLVRDAEACVSDGGVFVGLDTTCGGDSDGDGVADACDHCPSTPPRTTVRANGCSPGVKQHDRNPKR